MCIAGDLERSQVIADGQTQRDVRTSSGAWLTGSKRDDKVRGLLARWHLARACMHAHAAQMARIVQVPLRASATHKYEVLPGLQDEAAHLLCLFGCRYSQFSTGSTLCWASQRSLVST